MIELIIHESFPLQDKDRYIDIAVSIAKQFDDAALALPVTLEFDFYCVNACERPYTVSDSGHRWIVNALVAAKVLPGAEWKYINGFVDTFQIDAKDPRVVMRIVEDVRKTS